MHTSKSDQILVSICCATYNHQDYIKDAIEGFLMQETNFNFEIIVHDDASTDSTAEIIRAYEQQYPQLIRAVYQNTNKYSKRTPIFNTYILPQASGKYIALCEGDDYWTDKNKLQIQIDYMESNPTCSMCCHAHRRIDVDKRVLEIKRVFKNDSDIPTINCLKKDIFPQLCTYVYRKDITKGAPDFFIGNPVGDVTFLALYAIKGSVHYIDRVMASYRVKVSGSWTDRFSKDIAMRNNHRERMTIFYEELDKYTNGQFNNIIKNNISEYRFSNLIDNKQYMSAFKEEYFKNLSFKKKIMRLLNLFYPNNIPIFAQIKLIIKRKINSVE